MGCNILARARVAAAPQGGDLTLAAVVQAAELAEPSGAEASHAIFPLAPLIASFTAVSTTTRIELGWTTAWETRLAGFHLYRGETSAFDDATRITAELLPGTGAPGDYTFADQPPDTGLLYYWLEPVGDWASIHAGPLPVLWAGAPRVLLPLAFHNPPCTGLCATSSRVWLPLIAHNPSCREACARPTRIWLPLVAQVTSTPMRGEAPVAKVEASQTRVR